MNKIALLIFFFTEKVSFFLSVEIKRRLNILSKTMTLGRQHRPLSSCHSLQNPLLLQVLVRAPVVDVALIVLDLFHLVGSDGGVAPACTRR